MSYQNWGHCQKLVFELLLCCISRASAVTTYLKASCFLPVQDLLSFHTGDGFTKAGSVWMVKVYLKPKHFFSSFGKRGRFKTQGLPLGRKELGFGLNPEGICLSHPLLPRQLRPGNSPLLSFVNACDTIDHMGHSGREWQLPFWVWSKPKFGPNLSLSLLLSRWAYRIGSEGMSPYWDSTRSD